MDRTGRGRSSAQALRQREADGAILPPFLDDETVVPDGRDVLFWLTRNARSMRAL